MLNTAHFPFCRPAWYEEEKFGQRCWDHQKHFFFIIVTTIASKQPKKYFLQSEVWASESQIGQIYICVIIIIWCMFQMLLFQPMIYLSSYYKPKYTFYKFQLRIRYGWNIWVICVLIFIKFQPLLKKKKHGNQVIFFYCGKSACWILRNSLCIYVGWLLLMGAGLF